MATPNYKGQGQPAATSGGWLSGLFGATPAYAGAAQAPAVARPSMFGGSTPAYQAPAQSGSDPSSAPTQIAIVIPRQALEPQT